MQTRPYQDATLSAVEAHFTKHQSTLAVLPTGTGKTFIFAKLAADRVKHGRVLILAHRRELVHQAAEKVEAVTGITPSIEMASLSSPEDGMWLSDRPEIVVSSVQTQARRMDRFNPMHFGTIITDEAHHAISPTYMDVLRYYLEGNPECRHLGVTATPLRLDGKAMGSVYQSVAYRYELKDALRDGWLVPIRQRFIDARAQIDLSGVKTTAGDLNTGQSAKIMEAEKVVIAVSKAVLRHYAGRQTILFATSIAQAEMISEYINANDRSNISAVVSSKSTDLHRKHALEAYAAGSVKILCNVGILTEGFDSPHTQLVVVARPTKSTALYAQMIGRGTRTWPGTIDAAEDQAARHLAIAWSPKPFMEVMDFEGNSGKHKLVNAVNLLGGTSPDKVVKRAVRKAESSKEPVDVLETLESADVAERKAVEQRRTAAEARARSSAVKVTVSTRLVDPFDLMDTFDRPLRSSAYGRPASQKQIAFLRRHNVNPEGLTQSEAGQVVQALLSKYKDNSASPKQVALLSKYGYSAAGWSKREASEMIDKIAKNGWQRLDVTVPAEEVF